MKYTIEIKETKSGWNFDVYNGRIHIFSTGFDSFHSVVNEACQKLLFAKIETFDFGDGPVPAHQHNNGGGWVADTAHVDDTVYVGPDARVYGEARVLNGVKIFNNVRVYDQAQMLDRVILKDQARIHGTAIIEGSIVICDDVCVNSVKISKDAEITRNI